MRAVSALITAISDFHGKLKLFVPPAAEDVIDRMVQEDEGGWRYTDNPHDIDQGTFGGVRYITFAARWKKLFPSSAVITPEEFSHAAEHYPSTMKECCVYIYYMDYMQPIGAAFWADVKLPGVLEVLYSAATNVGTLRAVRWIQEIANNMSHGPLLSTDGIWGKKTETRLGYIIHAASKEYFSVEFLARFFAVWEDYYTEITLRNFKDWHDYAESRTNEKPKAYHGAFYRGWFNRVRRYRKRFSIWERM